ncbi:MAG: Fe-S oxidoreductase [Actinomycetia bacterium]|nr:Fe-S oxidoreductase [Actinomycetes bacterium]
MRILLVSTYELGHQPLHVASPAGALRRRGHDVRCVDLAVDDWDPAAVDDVDAVAVSVPMHTATRLALDVAASIGGRVPTCAYGLYAPAAAGGFDRAIAGEYHPALVEWVEGQGSGLTVHLQRGRFGLPARDLLPPLDRYAKLAIAGEERLVGAVEASHGCSSRCRHCPVPAVYDGRLRIVQEEAVLADVDQLVALGARHLTFADPDFLNGAAHSLRVARAVHDRHPHLTFDVTTKIELILKHRDVWDELAALGCLFVTTALECVDDHVLALLDKGHTAADASEAVGVLRAAGVEPRPSLLPFSPWTSLGALVALVDFVVDHDLAANVEPVHWGIRLLVPPGSLLLGTADFGPYDPAMLAHPWTSSLDGLQARVAAIVEADQDEPAVVTFRRVAAEIRTAAGLDPDVGVLDEGAGRPRLTEAWFCCAEPTCGQLLPLGSVELR